MSRAQAAQTFANLMKLTWTADISGYTDVPTGAWYAGAVSRCVAAGILTGTGGGSTQTSITSFSLLVNGEAAVSGTEGKAAPSPKKK